jgi:hypothetical protein
VTIDWLVRGITKTKMESEILSRSKLEGLVGDIFEEILTRVEDSREAKTTVVGTDHRRANRQTQSYPRSKEGVSSLKWREKMRSSTRRKKVHGMKWKKRMD